MRNARRATLWVVLAMVGGCGREAIAPAPAPPPAAIPIHEPAEGPVEMLSALDLFADVRAQTFSSSVTEYRTRVSFWSDGAHMRRFVHLPEGARIDTSDMDHWVFPAGTRFWKLFYLHDKLTEIDLIEKLAAGRGGFRFAAYAWDDASGDAALVPEGKRGVNGTRRVVPSVGACFYCHGKLEERVIGFSAIQLAHDGPGPTLRSLQAKGLLSTPAPDFVPPGDARAREALLYLHANCGHCHHERSTRPLQLRLSVRDRAVQDTQAFRTAVGVESIFRTPGAGVRIAPGRPEASTVHYRMSVRRKGEQMPNHGTEKVDDEGLALVDAWIRALEEKR